MERGTDRLNSPLAADHLRFGAYLEALLARLIHRASADGVFWADGERDRTSVLTRMGSDRFIGV
jgi:hypothetical protein